MNMNQEVVVAVVVGIVVGLVIALAIRWIKALISRATAANHQEPAQAKVKRAYKRKATDNLSGNKNAVTVTSSSNATKKRGGRTAKAKTLTLKTPATKEEASVMKRRPGRPTNANLASRQSAAGKSVKSKFTMDNNSETQSPVMPEQQQLLEKLLNLSPEQLNALAAMPIGEATFVPTKEILTT